MKGLSEPLRSRGGAPPEGRRGRATADVRSAVALYPTGVTVVSVRDGDLMLGMTAGSFSWASLSPPLALTSIRGGAPIREAIVRAQGFAVSVLTETQEPLARYFADPRRPPGRAQFTMVDWWPAPVTSAPMLGTCLAWFDCLLTDVATVGGHDVVFGRVVWADGMAGPAPLLYFQRSYHRLQPLTEEES